MNIMTNLGPVPRTALVDALRHDVRRADSGITLRMVDTSWGCTIVPERQEKPLSWRFTLMADGTSNIYKPHTATIPKIVIHYNTMEHLHFRDQILEFIDRGWI